jgi:predicted PurR-regulated permease PerM
MPLPDQIAKSTWTLASIVLVIAAIYFAQGVLIPIALAILLSFLLSPVCDWLERRGLGRIPSVMITAVLCFSLLAVVVWTAVIQVNELAPKLPEYQNNLREKFQAANQSLAGILNRVSRSAEEISQSLPLADPDQPALGTEQHPFSVSVISQPTSPFELVSGTLSELVRGLSLIGIVAVLVVFMLIRREDLRDRFIRLLGRSRLSMTTRVLEDAADRVSRYLLMLFVINASYGVAVTVGLFFIGVPGAILWGIIATSLRFVPYIGPWIAAAMPIGLSMAISSDWGPPAFTVGLFVVLELFSNNVMEPWLYGKNTGMSAVAVLIAAIFWTWLWGIAGLLLATPMTVCLLVIGKHIPQLEFLNILLGNEDVFDSKTRIYHRLLAGDQEEAGQVVEAELKVKSVTEVFDTLLIPALAVARSALQRGEIEEGRHKTILAGLEELVYESSEVLLDVGSTTAVDSRPDARILCIPARGETDAIAAMMLAQLLANDNCLVQLSTTRPSFDLLSELINKSHASVICITAMPPAAATHARHVCKWVRARYPDIRIIVSLLDSQGDLGPAIARIGIDSRTFVVPTLDEAMKQAHLLTDPPVPEGATDPVPTLLTQEAV